MQAKQTALELRERIRRTGLRVTAPRLRVLGHLVQTGAPISHSELTDELVGAGLDRATVFRNLKDLAEVGLVQRLDLGDRVWRYQARGVDPAGSEHVHPHFVCTRCGEIACLEDVSVVLTNSGAAPRALRARQVVIHIKGECDACRERGGSGA